MNVSVVIPAYNAAETIADTLSSLCAQLFVNWEAIVVDDGSIDATAAVVESFVERDSRFRLPNTGIPSTDVRSRIVRWPLGDIAVSQPSSRRHTTFSSRSIPPRAIPSKNRSTLRSSASIVLAPSRSSW